MKMREESERALSVITMLSTLGFSGSDIIGWLGCLAGLNGVGHTGPHNGPGVSSLSLGPSIYALILHHSNGSSSAVRCAGVQ